MLSYKTTSFKVMSGKSSLIGPNSNLIEQMIIMLLYKITSFEVKCGKSSLIGPTSILIKQMVMFLYKITSLSNYANKSN